MNTKCLLCNKNAQQRKHNWVRCLKCSNDEFKFQSYYNGHWLSIQRQNSFSIIFDVKYGIIMPYYNYLAANNRNLIISNNIFNRQNLTKEFLIEKYVEIEDYNLFA